MSKFRKKPVVIEAFKWGNHIDEHGTTIVHIQSEMPQWLIDAKENGTVVAINPIEGAIPELSIRTLEGEMRVSTGDWIIKGVKGEIYPCKPDIFEATYEEVSQ
jgi:hypothetical protein